MKSVDALQILSFLKAFSNSVLILGQVESLRETQTWSIRSEPYMGMLKIAFVAFRVSNHQLTTMMAMWISNYEQHFDFALSNTNQQQDSTKWTSQSVLMVAPEHSIKPI